MREAFLSGAIFCDADCMSSRGVIKSGSTMLHDVRLQQFLYLYFGGLLLFLAGLHHVEAAATEMTNLNWKPFIYGGMASIVAEFGT